MINDFLAINNYEIIIGNEKNINCYNINHNHRIVVEDLRSASFIAMGIIQNSGKKVLILTDDEQLSNGYTAFTEAKFQNTDVSVMLFQTVERVDPLYKRCFSQIISFSENMVIEKMYGPTLIICPMIDSKNAIDNISKALSDLLIDYNGALFFSKHISTKINNKKSIFPFYSSTGVISTYVGLMTDRSEQLICVCDESQLKLDLNIFNCRYISANFKLIVVGKPVAVEWLKENGFLLCSSENIDEFFTAKNKSICFIEGE